MLTKGAVGCRLAQFFEEPLDSAGPGDSTYALCLAALVAKAQVLDRELMLRDAVANTVLQTGKKDANELAALVAARRAELEAAQDELEAAVAVLEQHNTTLAAVEEMVTPLPELYEALEELRVEECMAGWSAACTADLGAAIRSSNRRRASEVLANPTTKRRRSGAAVAQGVAAPAAAARARAAARTPAPLAAAAAGRRCRRSASAAAAAAAATTAAVAADAAATAVVAAPLPPTAAAPEVSGSKPLMELPQHMLHAIAKRATFSTGTDGGYSPAAGHGSVCEAGVGDLLDSCDSGSRRTGGLDAAALAALGGASGSEAPLQPAACGGLTESLPLWQQTAWQALGAPPSPKPLPKDDRLFDVGDTWKPEDAAHGLSSGAAPALVGKPADDFFDEDSLEDALVTADAWLSRFYGVSPIPASW